MHCSEAIIPMFKKLLHDYYFYNYNYSGVFALPAFGGGAGGILLDNVYCSGGEERLEDCPHRGIGVHNCVHLKDAGVICGNGKALFLMHYYTCVK